MHHEATTFAVFLAAFAFALSVRGQSGETGVCVTDVVNISTVGKVTRPTIYEKSFALDVADYKAQAEFSQSSGHIVFPLDEGAGLVTTASRGLLQRVEVRWRKSLNSNAKQPVLVCVGSTEAYEGTADLYAVDSAPSDADAICQLAFNREQVDAEGNVVSIYEAPSATWRYFGMFPSVNNATVTELRFTWQLAHFCDDVRPGEYAPLCLPYSVAEADLDAVAAYTIVGRLTDETTGNAIVCEPTNRCVAGQPYVIMPKHTGAALRYTGAPASEAASRNGLHGVFAETTSEALSASAQADVYVVDAKAFRPLAEGETLAAHTAYLRLSEVPEVQPAEADVEGRILIPVVADTGGTLSATAPRTASQTVSSAAGHYDLFGRPCSTSSSRAVLITPERKSMWPLGHTPR